MSQINDNTTCLPVIYYTNPTLPNAYPTAATATNSNLQYLYPLPQQPLVYVVPTSQMSTQPRARSNCPPPNQQHQNQSYQPSQLVPMLQTQTAPNSTSDDTANSAQVINSLSTAADLQPQNISVTINARQQIKRSLHYLTEQNKQLMSLFQSVYVSRNAMLQTVSSLLQTADTANREGNNPMEQWSCQLAQELITQVTVLDQYIAIRPTSQSTMQTIPPTMTVDPSTNSEAKKQASIPPPPTTKVNNLSGSDIQSNTINLPYKRTDSSSQSGNKINPKYALSSSPQILSKNETDDTTQVNDDSHIKLVNEPRQRRKPPIRHYSIEFTNSPSQRPTTTKDSIKQYSAISDSQLNDDSKCDHNAIQLKYQPINRQQLLNDDDTHAHAHALSINHTSSSVRYASLATACYQEIHTIFRKFFTTEHDPVNLIQHEPWNDKFYICVNNSNSLSPVRGLSQRMEEIQKRYCRQTSQTDNQPSLSYFSDLCIKACQKQVKLSQNVTNYNLLLLEELCFMKIRRQQHNSIGNYLNAYQKAIEATEQPLLKAMLSARLAQRLYEKDDFSGAASNFNDAGSQLAPSSNRKRAHRQKSQYQKTYQTSEEHYMLTAYFRMRSAEANSRAAETTNRYDLSCKYYNSSSIMYSSSIGCCNKVFGKKNKNVDYFINQKLDSYFKLLVGNYLNLIYISENIQHDYLSAVKQYVCLLKFAYYYTHPLDITEESREWQHEKDRLQQYVDRNKTANRNKYATTHHPFKKPI